MKALILAVLLLASACTPAPEAPGDLADLSLFLYAEFQEDDASLVAGLENLSDILASDFDYAADWSERQVKQPALTEEFLGGAPTTAAFDPALQKTVALAYRSRHPVQTHALGALDADQEPREPSASTHDRTFLTDPGCWRDGSCDALDTMNFIVKSNILYTVPYDATKNFRRFTLSDGRDVMVARVDQPEIGYAEVGQTSIDQNYALDAWIEDPADPTACLRIEFIWTAVTINGDTLQEVNIDGIISEGVENMYAAHDAWFDEH